MSEKSQVPTWDDAREALAMIDTKMYFHAIETPSMTLRERRKLAIALRKIEVFILQRIVDECVAAGGPKGFPPGGKGHSFLRLVK